MFLKQVSIFIENRQGRLDEVMELIGSAGIDLAALSIAETENYGILRAIVSDPEKAVEVVRAGGYTAKLADVVAVAVPDAPGGLAGVLRFLKEGGVNIEYLYSLVRQVGGCAVLVLRLDDPERAVALFGKKGIRLVGQGDLKA